MADRGGAQHAMSTDRRLTVGDIEVARIGLGTNRLTNTSENRALLREALAAGINMIDTAHLYTGGESERTIAAALSPFPDGWRPTRSSCTTSIASIERLRSRPASGPLRTTRTKGRSGTSACRR